MRTLLLLLLLTAPSTLAAEEPWSVDDRHPVRIDDRPAKPHRHGGFLGFYQTWISSFDGPKCPMHPTCSAYAANSFKRYGFWIGLLLTTDRLIHEGGNVDLFHRHRVGGIPRFVDPIERNLPRKAR